MRRVSNTADGMMSASGKTLLCSVTSRQAPLCPWTSCEASVMHSTELELVHQLIEHNRHTRQGGIAERRQTYDRAQAAFGALGVERGKQVDAGGCSAEWVRPVLNGGSVVLYLHGGAFALGSVESHRHLSAAVGAAANAGVLALDYSRPPEHPFPAAVDDAVAAYHWLRNQGVRHDRIALAGDSAGAGLALSTVLRLRAEGSPLPAAVAAMSPWADLSCSGASHRERLARDPLLTIFKSGGYWVR
jgi:acetyl esterase/lipase